MARKKRIGELPSGNIRRRIFVGYEYMEDDKGAPILDENGKQKKKRIYKSVTASSSAEADDMAMKVKGNKNRLKPNSDKLFRDARKHYIDNMRAVLSPSTIRGYSQMNTYFKDIDNIKINALDDDTIQRWVNKFSTDHSPKTTRNAYGLISRVLSDYDAKPSVKLPSKEVKDVYVPSDDDVQAIVKHFRDRNDTDMVIAICLASFATLRRSEICGLSSADVNGSIIHVHNSVVVNDKKENVLKTKVKNKSSDRYIEIPQFVADMLPKEGMIVNISPDNITNRFGRGLASENIKPFRFHDLRHYSASIMHAIGVPDVYIMERGGWSSDETLKRVYRGSIESYKQKFVEQTNKHFETMHHVCTTENGEGA